MFGTRARVLAVLGGALLLAACGSGQDAAATGGNIAIVAGVAATGSSTALQLGIEKGYFKEEGLDVTLGRAATGAGAITQVINGQQQVALGGISPVVTAAASNIPVMLVSGSVTDSDSPGGTINQTIVRGDSPIHSFADLAGKTVAVNSVKCCWEFWIREAVAKSGGDPAAVKLVQLPFPDQVTALKSGSIDAISTTQPYATQLREEGFRDIGDSPAVAFDNPNNGNTLYYMSKQFIAANPGVVEKWRRALQKSSDYANAHPDEVRAKIVEQTKADPKLIAQAPLPVYSAVVDRATIEKEAQFAVKYGVIQKAPDYASFVAP